MRQASRRVENPDSIASERGRNRGRVLACIVAHALFAAAVLFVTLHHEPWRDEADSWLLTRDTTLRQMLRVVPYAGTQAFWYLVLEPWASSGMPFVTQSLINWAIIATAAGLLIWRSPFPLYISIPAWFSYFVAYEYGVIARSYGLGVLMLFLAVLSWRSRADHPSDLPSQSVFS